MTLDWKLEYKILFLGLSLMICVTLDKLLHLSPLSRYLHNGVIKLIFPDKVA